MEKDKEENLRHVNYMIKLLKEFDLIDSKYISDTRHTFGELYKERALLYSIICNEHQDISWKSHKHFLDEDQMFNDDFIVGINTIDGLVTHHFNLQYWDLFQIKEIDRAPEYDGSDNYDNMKRIISINKRKG